MITMLASGAVGLTLAAGAATVAAWPLAVVIHEAGHATMILLLRLRLVAVEMGEGPVIWSRRVGDVRFVCRRLVLMGGRARCRPRVGSMQRWQSVLVLIGGAAANFGIAVGVIALTAHLGSRSTNDEATIVGAIVLGVVTANLWLGVTSIWPMTVHGQKNDGAQILDTLATRLLPLEKGAEEVAQFYACFEAGSYSEAEAILDGLLPGRTSDPWVLATRLDLHSRLFGVDAALERYRAVVTYGPPRSWIWSRSGSEAWLHANLAFVMARASGPRDHEQIEAMAHAAIVALHGAPVAKGTLGAALLAQGRVGEAEPLLMEGVRGCDSDLDRADFSGCLADAARARGDAAMAADFEGLRAHLLANA